MGGTSNSQTVPNNHRAGGLRGGRVDHPRGKDVGGAATTHPSHLHRREKEMRTRPSNGQEGPRTWTTTVLP